MPTRRRSERNWSAMPGSAGGANQLTLPGSTWEEVMGSNLHIRGGDWSTLPGVGQSTMPKSREIRTSFSLNDTRTLNWFFSVARKLPVAANMGSVFHVHGKKNKSWIDLTGQICQVVHGKN